MTAQRYQTRIIAYGDILGWACKCKDEKQLDRLFKAANGIALHAQGFSQGPKEAPGTQFAFFSDNFAISAPAEDGESLFKILSWRTTNLLQSGFMVRGGVAIGQLHHNPKIIFGPALVEAVHIEKDAGFPRFPCSQGLLEYLEGKSYKNKVIFQDCCEDWVANTLYYNKEISPALYDLLIKKIQQEILRMMEDKNRKKDIRKWQYMKRMLPKMYDITKAF